jgi:hypothetical protein
MDQGGVILLRRCAPLMTLRKERFKGGGIAYYSGYDPRVRLVAKRPSRVVYPIHGERGRVAFSNLFGSVHNR